ncbi:uncharacterized protein LOC121409091 isoform X2 [Lytechinus variegatus]|uniref:uncharacterized protein LOC121409091 isoform X2 n=1 Tax=Lytechinus variegatus TaxID=7654 RepID=UPI001BB23192|nr:uncharacterized protein LOC121409091 isoform X2 [Lytechinus variegatus]
MVKGKVESKMEEFDASLVLNESDPYYRPCNITEDEKEMVFGISFGFGLASLIAVFTIIGHAVLEKRYLTSEIRPVVHLSIANAGFCLCLITLDILYMFTSMKVQETTTIYLITLEEVFYLVSFNLTANYSMVVYARLKTKLCMSEDLQTLETTKTMRRYIRISYFLSWFLPPLLLVPITVAVLAKHFEIQFCYLCPTVIYSPRSEGTLFDSSFLKNIGIISVIVTYFFVVLTISIFFSLSQRICTKLLKNENIEVHDQREIRWLRTRMSLHILSFIYCWTPAFLISILVLVVDLWNVVIENCAPLFYVWAVTAPCYGLILAVIYFYTIYFQNTRSQILRERRPFGSRIYRFYGTGSQRSRWPRVRTPSPSVSEGSQVEDTNANVGRVSSPPNTALSTVGVKKSQRSPSFLGLLKTKDNEQKEGEGVENPDTF